MKKEKLMKYISYMLGVLMVLTIWQILRWILRSAIEILPHDPIWALIYTMMATTALWVGLLILLVIVIQVIIAIVPQN